LSKKLFNLHTHGEYDYASQVIELNNELFNRSKDDISRIINIEDVKELHGRELELYQTYVHEMTHFIDSTTTLWGLEFTCRMYRWFNDKSPQYLEVVALNDAEITMHQNLRKEDLELTLNFKEINFSLEYSDTVGVFVHLHYLSEFGEPLQSIPLSMLSIFEGHAYAQEKLIACKIYEDNEDVISLGILNREINEQISELKSSEYTGLLGLAMQLLPNVKLSRKLELICIISKFCFNTPALFLAMTPEDLLREIFSGAPQDYVSSLKMELSRGANRSSLALVILLSIIMQANNDDGFLNDLTTEQIEILILNIYARGNQSPSNLKAMIKAHWLIEFELLIKICGELGAELPSKMASQAIDLDWYASTINEFSLPQIMLRNGDWVSFKKPLDFNVQKHFDDMLANSIELEAGLVDYGIRREHKAPSFYHGWLQHMKYEGTGLYIHDD
jgi:hypothetical protein